MILVGNSRGGAKDLAQHLLKEENDHIDVHELRGFASQNLTGALNEAYAISRATRCRKFLFSLSLNPPLDKEVSIDAFETAIEKVETKLGLENNPRAIVFHEKEGRRHCHAVWSRIKPDDMKAVHMAHSRRKMMDVARELFLEHGWEMPRGLANPVERNPTNFTLAEWQQAKRTKTDPRETKAAIQDAWAISDSRVAFTAALEERGFKLAQGDRRSFVAVDMHGEVYSIPRTVKTKTKDVRVRLGDPDTLWSVARCKEWFADQIKNRLITLQDEQHSAGKLEAAWMKQERDGLVHRQRVERLALRQKYEQRRTQETKARQERYNKGLRGLLDRLTGKRTKIRLQNEDETHAAAHRDRTEKEAMIFKHVSERRVMKDRIAALRVQHTQQQKELAGEISHFDVLSRETQSQALEKVKRTRKPTTERKPRRSRRSRGQDHGPEHGL